MTDSELRQYQLDAGLVADGVLGPMTRASLLADELIAHISDLIGFRGSLGLIIRCEGFKGRPYWPGGQSGVTLDYGWDLAHQSEADLRRLYGDLWPASIDRLCGALGLRGQAARTWLGALPVEGWEWPWHLTREQAAQILPRAAGPYWGAAVRACPALRDAPPRVQTALLSVTYSAWVGPLICAKRPIEIGDWADVARIVRRSRGSKDRRELEAGLIESAVKEGA